jgi:putative peptidoglycan lipid II flippase
MSGIVLAAALWFAARFASIYFVEQSALREEIILVSLVLVGTVVYSGLILLLFGRDWLRSLMRA